MATVAPIPYSPSMHVPQENKSCGGCGKSVEVDTGAVVVAFGNSLWHVDCFKCAKCGDRVSADKNLLLLSDGSPVCASCTYNCAVCKKPISDEAIMTGEESYHAACFTCKTCGRHIGELVFARTTQGIYCMACHNERVARSRRHAEQRRNRSKSQRDGHRDRDKDRKAENTPSRDNTASTGDPTSPPNTPGFHGGEITKADAAVTTPARRVSTQSLTGSLRNSVKPSQTEHLPPPPASPINAHTSTSPTITTTPVQSESSSSFALPKTPSSSRGDLLPLPRESDWLGPRRKSFDDGVRPLNGLLPPETVSSLSRAPSTGSGRNRAEKRAPLNPALVLDWASGADAQIRDSPTNLSPVTSSPTRNILSRQPASRGSPDSVERSASPDRPNAQSSADGHRSSPPSPHLNAISENSNGTPKELTEKKHSTLDLPLQHKSSNQHIVTGGASPPPPSIDDPVVPQAEPLAKESPSDAEDTADEPDSREQNHSMPLALPPISLSASDTNFSDLLHFGDNRQDEEKLVLPEKPEENGTRYDRSQTGSPKPPATITVPSPKALPVSPRMKPLSSVPPPLSNPPKRNASLARKPNFRKPAPKAIILPDSFEADMTIELDESQSSPSSIGHPDALRKASDSAASRSRRPLSAGTVSFTQDSPNAKARRSSDNFKVGSTFAAMGTPTQPDIHNIVAATPDTGSHRTARPADAKQNIADSTATRLKEALTEAQENGVSTVRLDREFLEVVYSSLQNSQEQLKEVWSKFDRMRRTSKHFINGLSVAQDEYDKELTARREAEAEVTRLKIQLSGQAARLTQLSAQDRKRAIGEQLSRDMSANLDGLERDLSRIMAERDLAVAEVEEFTASKQSSNHGEAGLQRSLTQRFENLKNKYKRELEPLTRQREAILREINELKEERNLCLEETTALNARNEQLAALNAQTARQIEAASHVAAMRTWSSVPATIGAQKQPQVTSTPKTSLPQTNMYYGSVSSASTSQEERDEPKSTPNEKKLKWFKPGKDSTRPINDTHPLGSDKDLMMKHNFQQLTVLRVARCDYCGDKMWGSLLRCSLCNTACHHRCIGQVNSICSGDGRLRDDVINISPLQPSMFGRDLIEQVRADSVHEHRDIPIIVEKCVEAVEIHAMDYEGVYRKTGGSAQSKAITQLFEQGNYEAFDFNNLDVFNDISSVTSVLKTYFRQLPNPLLTNALHDAFVGAASLRDPREKANSLSTLVYQLPSEHFHTLRYLMLHLCRIQRRSAENLMTARNLGVVFGPTLMRSGDPTREFADMAGKALAIEWLIENAFSVFREES